MNRDVSPNSDPRQSDQLFTAVYHELRRLASRRLQHERAESLQTTDLVHEVYLRLIGSEQSWQGNTHFFAAAAESMRRILVDRARRRRAARHGGDRLRKELHDSALAAFNSPEEVLVVDELFDTFADEHPKEAETAKLRYFAGFTLDEAATALGISTSTAHRHWEFARAWLFRMLSRCDGP